MNYLLLVSFLVLVVDGTTDSKREWLNKMEGLRSIIQRNPDLVRHTPQESKTTGINDFNVELECTPQVTNVHRLRPQDIDIIGAMGDSITAASGATANTIAGILLDNPGVSWSVGGEGSLEDTLTVANILREFNPNLMGYSLGIGRDSADEWFNVAVPGARSMHMENQAWDLVNKMRNDSRVDIERDWKLVTMFIGGNDLCALERDPIGASPTTYRNNIQTALDILHQELPRTLINIVEILEVHLLPQIVGGYGANPNCIYAQRLFCNYVSAANETEKEDIIEQNHLYQQYVQELIDSGKYDTRDDFSVVIQPFFRHTVLPYTEDGQVDATFFAPDCFHFSAKGHAMGAVNIWNNMMEPVGAKSTEWSIQDLKCPTEEAPYIYTRLNSPATTTTSATTTTTVHPATTSSAKPFECEPLQCSEYVPDWVIAVITVLSAAVLVQTMVLFVSVFCSKSKTRRVVGSSDSFRSQTKM